MTIVVTNYLTKLNFNGIPATMPSTWDLSTFIPGGILDITHLEVRYRPTGAYWQPWGPVDAWSPTTRVATWFRAISIEQIEFRRSTPRYSLWLDPKAQRSRVSQTNLQTNADQGLFVATEWAAQYGIDPYAVPLADPGDGPNALGLVQNTQNHFGPDANFGDTEWDFQFSGGYIDRSHVKAQALVNGLWVQLGIDPAVNDPAHPNPAPFRFIGDYQLFLDLSTLGGTVTGLVIYRFTPRAVNVSVPADNTRIRGSNMEPGARHAFFVAVEIGEALAKRAPPCECEQFYVTAVYPVLIEDTMSIGNMALGPTGVLWGLPDDSLSIGRVSLSSGALTSIINPVDYVNQRDINPDSLSIGKLTLPSGTLTSIINAVSYNNQRDINPDSLSIGKLALPSGALTVTISYVNYNNQRDINPDSLSIGKLSLQSGTLT